MQKTPKSGTLLHRIKCNKKNHAKSHLISSSRVTFSILPSDSPSLALAPVAAVSGRTDTAAAIWLTVSRLSGRYRVRDRSRRLGGTLEENTGTITKMRKLSCGPFLVPNRKDILFSKVKLHNSKEY